MVFSAGDSWQQHHAQFQPMTDQPRWHRHLNRRARRWLVVVGKWLLVLLIAWGISSTLSEGIDELKRTAWHLRPSWLFLAGATYLVGLAPSAIFWHRILGALGQSPQWFETLRAYYIGHLGKYVPGKALVVVLRTVLIRSRRVDAPVAALSVFYETLTMMAIGALVAAALVAIGFRQHRWLVAVALGLMLTAGVPLVPAVFTRLLGWLRIERYQPGLIALLRKLRWPDLLTGWIGIAGGWALLGASLWATLRSMGTDIGFPSDLPLCIAAASLAVVAGFLSMIPGGAVVREAVLLELMAPRFGDGLALAAVLALRLVWLLAELIISVILYFVGSGSR